MITSLDIEVGTNGNLIFIGSPNIPEQASIVDPPNIRVEDLDGMKIHPKIAEEVTRQGSIICLGDTDSCFKNQHNHIPGSEEIKVRTGGDTLLVLGSKPLPKRTPIKPYPRVGNHVALPAEVINEAQRKTDSEHRQVERLNKRHQKGKISEKNYLHQLKSIIS